MLNEETINKWQKQVDLLAQIVDVPVVLVSRCDHQVSEAVIVNRSPDCPWQRGEKVPSAEDLYCYYVTQSDRELLVPNALSDGHWAKGPDACLGFVSYYGVPVHLPDGSVWGTLCVMDRKENTYTANLRSLIGLFADSLERDILLWDTYVRAEENHHHLQKAYLSLKNANDALLERQKQACLGEIVAGVAHEIKNPLQFVISNAQFLSEQLTAFQQASSERLMERCTNQELFQQQLAEGVTLAEEIFRHGERIKNIINNMLVHSRFTLMEQKNGTDINELLKSSYELAYLSLRPRGKITHVNLIERYDPDLSSVDLSQTDIGRVFVNIISNALYELSCTIGGKLREQYSPTIWLLTEKDDQWASIVIRDNGRGVPSKIKEKIFNPFFTTKPASEGTGLGLSIARKVINEDHNGTLEVKTQEGEFTEFIIKIPLSKSPSTHPLEKE